MIIKNLLNPNGIHGPLLGQYHLTHQVLGVLPLHLAVLVLPVVLPVVLQVLLAAHHLGNQVGEQRDTIIYHSLQLLLKHHQTNKI